jgi:hypothetical protein
VILPYTCPQKASSYQFDGLKFTNVPDKRFSHLDVMAGWEYAGFTNTQLTLEIADQYFF